MQMGSRLGQPVIRGEPIERGKQQGELPGVCYARRPYRRVDLTIVERPDAHSDIGRAGALSPLSPRTSQAAPRHVPVADQVVGCWIDLDGNGCPRSGLAWKHGPSAPDCSRR